MRAKVLNGETYQVGSGCGIIYVTVNCDDEGVIQEIFIRLGKAGGCASAQNESIGRLASLALRRGATPEEIHDQLVGVKCLKPPSCGDVVAQVIKDYFKKTEGQDD